MTRRHLVVVLAIAGIAAIGGAAPGPRPRQPSQPQIGRRSPRPLTALAEPLAHPTALGRQHPGRRRPGRRWPGRRAAGRHGRRAATAAGGRLRRDRGAGLVVGRQAAGLRGTSRRQLGSVRRARRRHGPPAPHHGRRLRRLASLVARWTDPGLRVPAGGRSGRLSAALGRKPEARAAPIHHDSRPATDRPSIPPGRPMAAGWPTQPGAMAPTGWRR